jgi:elongation factor Ts
MRFLRKLSIKNWKSKDTNLTEEGKPANIIDNILKGKMQRFYKDNTLVHQDFIKDSSVSVADYVKSVNADLKVTGFVRVALS